MNPSNIHRIQPYLGIDQVQFGMTPTHVAMLWGEADRISKNILNERIEYRNGIVTTYSLSETTLIEIGLKKLCTEIQLNNIYILKPPKIDRIKELLAIDNEVYEDVGMIVFKNLGISITGFMHDDDSDVAICAFGRGRWDDDFLEMKLFDRKSVY